MPETLDRKALNRALLAIRPLLQAPLERGLRTSQWGPAVAGLDLPAVLTEGRERLTERSPSATYGRSAGLTPSTARP